MDYISNFQLVAKRAVSTTLRLRHDLSLTFTYPRRVTTPHMIVIFHVIMTVARRSDFVLDNIRVDNVKINPWKERIDQISF